MTSTSAGILSWYKKAAKSFFIWMLLSSISDQEQLKMCTINLWGGYLVCVCVHPCIQIRIRATVKILRLQRFHTLCWRSRNGSNMSSPPSCTTHQMSILPFFRSSLLGNQLMPLGTMIASSLLEATRMHSANHTHTHTHHSHHKQLCCDYRQGCCHIKRLPMNSFQDSLFLQLSGQQMTMVLCLIPPRPAFWTLHRYTLLQWYNQINCLTD